MIPTENSTQLSLDNTAIAFESRSDKELRKMHSLFAIMNKKFMVQLGTRLVQFGFSIYLPIKWIIKKTLFNHFCGGETIQECEKTIQQLSNYKIGTILDYSVEGEKSEKSFEATKEEIIKTIEKAKGNSAIPFCVFKITGIGNFNLLEKIQSKETLTEEEKNLFIKLKNRVDAICKKAFESNVNIFIDAEETWIQNTIDDLCYEMMKKYNKEKPIVYNTFQMYRKDMLENLKASFKKATEESYYLGVKLVRGAYMEKERARAIKQSKPDLIQSDKNATDRDYNQALAFCVENINRIHLCAGTHNEYSTIYLTELMKKNNIPTSDQRIYFSQLYGMSDHISYNLAHAGYHVAKYVPYGPVKSVMPYLFRRAQENTAIAGQSSREFLLIKKEIQRRKNNKQI